jgi:hypothetical protein
MRQAALFLALSMSSANLLSAQEADTLIAESDPAIQAQITRTYNAFLAAGGDVKTNCKALDEVRKLKEHKSEVVKQLAIFVATTDSEEDSHVLLTGFMLNLIDPPPSVPIRVLAPYLDADNDKLRDFARMWFRYHDSHDRTHGRPPLGSVNYYQYMHYVGNQLVRNEEIPTAFIEYIYEQHPGKALLVFAYATRQAVGVGQLRILRAKLDARRQGRELEEHEARQLRADRQQQEVRQQHAKELQYEILLAEHIVSNAIWLQENGFVDRFQKALPEANAQLAKLTYHKEWWVRLYVAKTMRLHPELRQDDAIKTLAKDSNPIVAKAASPNSQ